MSSSLTNIDALITKMEDHLGFEEEIDPWASVDLQTTSITSREKCGCGYILTKPFETRCPCCGFKDPSKLPLAFDLPPTEEISKRLHAQNQAGKKSKGKEGKKGKTEQKKSKKQKTEATIDPSDDFNKTHLQVSKIETIEPHPDAEALYVCSVNIGDGETRQLVAGLRSFYKPEELKGKLVVTVLNLKPSKLRGVESQAMALAGDVTSEGGEKNVKICVPVEGCEIGDRVYLQDGMPTVDAPKQVSSKVWQRVVKQLSVKSGVACFGDKKIVTEKGVVSCDLPDGAGIH